MTTPDKYAASGVDEPREQAALASMLSAFSRTYSLRSGSGSPNTEDDHFGSLINITKDIALAISTDGVGTKLLIAQDTCRYREIAHDLIANNVNDILCMGAEPVAFVDYIGLDVADEQFLTEFAEGLADAAVEARVSIVGGEIAQIGTMLNPAHRSPRFDVVGTAVGLCSIGDGDTWPAGLSRRNVGEGSCLIALPSSGLHSNGFSLARSALLDEGGLDLFEPVESLGSKALFEHLLVPTRIYVKQVLPLLKKGLLQGVANISGGGLLTISRLNPTASFVVDSVPEPSPIFQLIQNSGRLTNVEMCSTFNMGLGFVLAVDQSNVAEVQSMLEQIQEPFFVIGRVTNDLPPGTVDVPPLKIRGKGHRFESR